MRPARKSVPGAPGLPGGSDVSDVGRLAAALARVGVARDAAALRHLLEQLVTLLGALRVFLLHLLEELADLVVALRVLDELVVDLRALERVVLDRDEVVDDVRCGGSTLTHGCTPLLVEVCRLLRENRSLPDIPDADCVKSASRRSIAPRDLRWGRDRDLADPSGGAAAVMAGSGRRRGRPCRARELSGPRRAG